MNRKNAQCTQFDLSGSAEPFFRATRLGGGPISGNLGRPTKNAAARPVGTSQMIRHRSIRRPAQPHRPRRWAQNSHTEQSGQTLVEVMVAISVLAFMVVSLYAGFSSGFAVLRVARENLRATQILAERMEVLRLIKWEDVAPGFIPTTFEAPFYPVDSGNPTPGGFDYAGTVTITNAPLTESYAGHMRMIQIDLTWKSGNVARSRQMITYVSQYGLQNYLY